MKKKTENSIAIIVLAMVIIILATITIFCMLDLKREFFEDGWQETKGIVLINEPYLSGGIVGKYKMMHIKVNLTYEYIVKGVKYTSNTISKGADFISKDYRRGDSITVYYDPRKPEDAVLRKTKVKPNLVIFMVMMILFLLCCIFALRAALKDYQKG